MKLKHIALQSTMLIWCLALDGQTNRAERLFIPFFDTNSQSNVVVSVCDIAWTGSRPEGHPCPLEYTNLVSNTNLFRLDEMAMLHEVMKKYKGISTNSGPPGTKLLDLYKTNLVSLNTTNESWVASFQYTDSNAREEIWFNNGISARYLTKEGNGYVVGIGVEAGGETLRFSQMKGLVMDGINVDFFNNVLESYIRYTNGMAIGNYFMWNPKNNHLILAAEFKQPYDIQKNRIAPKW